MARKPDLAAVSMHDKHRLALPIRACARSFFKMSVFFHARCYPAQALAWMTQVRTRIRICQRIMKTPARQAMERTARQMYAAIF